MSNRAYNVIHVTSFTYRLIERVDLMERHGLAPHAGENEEYLLYIYIIRQFFTFSTFIKFFYNERKE